MAGCTHPALLEKGHGNKDESGCGKDQGAVLHADGQVTGCRVRPAPPPSSGSGGGSCRTVLPKVHTQGQALHCAECTSSGPSHRVPDGCVRMDQVGEKGC